LAEGHYKERPGPVQNKQFLPKKEKDKLRQVTEASSFGKQVKQFQDTLLSEHKQQEWIVALAREGRTLRHHP